MKKTLLALVALVLCAGCAQYKDIHIDQIAIKQFNMTGLSSALVKVEATVNNPTRSKISLRGAQGCIKLDGKEMATFVLNDTLLFAPRVSSTQEGGITLKITDIATLFSGTMDLDQSLIDKVTLDVDASFKCGVAKGTWNVTDMPAKNFIDL